jgi:hypothetical protein
MQHGSATSELALPAGAVELMTQPKLVTGSSMGPQRLMVLPGREPQPSGLVEQFGVELGGIDLHLRERRPTVFHDESIRGADVFSRLAGARSAAT